MCDVCFDDGCYRKSDIFGVLSTSFGVVWPDVRFLPFFGR